jgi:hypothetical protein
VARMRNSMDTAADGTTRGAARSISHSARFREEPKASFSLAVMAAVRGAEPSVERSAADRRVVEWTYLWHIRIAGRGLR